MPPPSPASVLAELARLTTSLFSADELRRLFGYWPADRPLATEIALDGAPAAIADAAVQCMHRTGLIDEFLALIRAERGRRAAEIDAVGRRWLAATRGEPAEPLPLTHALERVQHIAEGDDVVVHRETTSLHLLYALVMVAPLLRTRRPLVEALRPVRLLRALQSLAEKERAAGAPTDRTTTAGYEQLWTRAREFARQQQDQAVGCTHMYAAICALQPTSIGEYLKLLRMNWDGFGRHVTPLQAVKRGVGKSDVVELMRAEDDSTRATPPGHTPHPIARPKSQDPRQEDEDIYYLEVFQDLVNRKVALGEDIGELSFEPFAERLRGKARSLLNAPDACALRVEVYERDGKAAIRVDVVRTSAPSPRRAARAPGRPEDE